MSGETNIEEPPFVLQNCSAISRQAAMSTKCQTPKRGWGLGWLRGGNNNNDSDESNKINIAPKAEEPETAEGSETGTDSTASVPQILKSVPSDVLSSSSDTQPTAPAATAIHPPSPKSLSPRNSKPAVQSNGYNNETNSKKQSPTRNSRESGGHDGGVGRGGVSPDELSRHKRREKVRQKTAWYEEYIRKMVASDGGGLSSLHKEEMVALGLFDKQRRLDRRIQLFGRRDTDDETGLTDDEMEQLLDLADRCNQAQIDEDEMEILLVEMENGQAVDMNRLYHLELRSRKRVGEILNEEELDALKALDEKQRDRDAFEELSQKKSRDGGIGGDEAARLEELTLLQRKRNGNQSLTPEQLQAAEIIEMRREDARLDERDYQKLRRLKQQGNVIDEDRFSLLSLIDRQRRGSKLAEAEFDILEKYFELREEEYLERIESTVALEKKDSHDVTTPGMEQTPDDSLSEDETETEMETEKQWTGNAADNKEQIDQKSEDSESPVTETLDKSLDRKERDEKTIGNQLHRIESISKQQVGDDTVTDASIEMDHAENNDGQLEAEEHDKTKSTPTYDETDISESELKALEEFQERLKKHGLPLTVSFPLIAEDDASRMSDVSFSDESYIRDLLMQQEDRAGDRKEECLEEAYRIYKRVTKKQHLPESEERLLATFAKVLKQENKAMREADEKFDRLVEREVALYEQRKQEDHELTDETVAIGGGNGKATEANEETLNNTVDMRSKDGGNAGAKIGAEGKCNTEIGKKTPVNASDDTEANRKGSQTNASDDTEVNRTEPPISKRQGWGIGFFRRNSSDSIENEAISQAKEAVITDGKLLSSKEAWKAEVEPTESEESEEKATTQGIGSARFPSKLQGEEESETRYGDRRNDEASGVEPIQDDDTQNVEDANVGSRLNGDQQMNEIDEDEFASKPSEPEMGLGFHRFGTKNEENTSMTKETVESEETVPEGFAAKEFRPRAHALSTMMPIASDHSTSMETAAQWEVMRALEIAENKVLAKSHDQRDKDGRFSDLDGQSQLQDSKGTMSTRLNGSSELQSSQTESSVSISSVECSIVDEEDISSRLRDTMRSIERKVGTNIYSPTEDVNNVWNQSEPSGEFITYMQKLNSFESSPEGRIDRNRNSSDNKKKAVGISTSDFEYDLLYELELIHRLKKGIPLTERQERELDLLILVRQGGTLSLADLKEFKRLKKDREKISLHLGQLYAQKSGSEPIKVDLLYEVELFHKALGEEPLSQNEQIEIGIFERRMDGQILRDVDLRMLGLLRDDRLNAVSEGSTGKKSLPMQIDDHHPESKGPSVSTSLIRHPTDHHSAKETIEAIDEGSNHRVHQPISRRSDDRIHQSMSGRSNHRIDQSTGITSNDQIHQPISGRSNHRIDRSLSTSSNHRTHQSISGRSNHRIDRSISSSSNHRTHQSISGRSNHRIDRSISSSSNHRPVRRFDRMMSQRSMMSGRSSLLLTSQQRSSSRLLTNQRSVRKLERMISRRSNRLLTDPQSMMDDDDSVYRRELLERQKAGKRLDKNEFCWLHILMKKSRNEKLDKDDLDELENMRSHRNETDVYHINTKKLIEEEIERKRKKKEKDRRRKEREEKRKQRREEKRQRKRNARMRRPRIDLQRSIQSSSDESSNMKKEVQIIGTPNRFEEDQKEEPETGIFGGVFGKSAQKRRQEQQLEEAKRLQAELIKEQMKALALDNEAEELEREKVMQQQLVEETIEKKRADSVDGSSSWYSSTDDDFWFGDSDSSSWSSSYESSSSGDLSPSETNNEIPKISERTENSDNRGIPVKPAELSKSIVSADSNERSDDRNGLDVSLKVTSIFNKSTNHSLEGEIDQSDRQSKFQASQCSIQSKGGGSGKSINSPRWKGALGSHLKKKKKKKKRTKHGDDMSLGTLQLSKAPKEALVKKSSGHSIDKEEKAKCRPWVKDDQNDSPTKCTHPDIAQNGVQSDKDEVINENSLDFHHSFVSKISEDNENGGSNDGKDNVDGEAEDKEHTDVSFFSDSEHLIDDDTAKVNFTGTTEHSLMDSRSFALLDDEAYGLGLQEYENMESRLDDMIQDKQAEFDLTWDTTFADESVIAQINQRLRERQRAMEAKREKKKEKRERKKSKVVPRLFLFEGERVAKNGGAGKKKKKSKKKLDRTLTGDFRKAMKEIFDRVSDSDGEYVIEQEFDELRDDCEEDKIDLLPAHLSSTLLSSMQRSFADDDSEPLSFSEIDPSQSPSIESVDDEEDDDGRFDDSYLKRLRERSMPSDMKKMLSGRITVASNRHPAGRNLDSQGNERSPPKAGRRPRRKKNGEIASDDVDPAEVYLQEVEKQNAKKDVTIAGLKKELEDENKNSFQDFVREHTERFGSFDHLASVGPPQRQQAESAKISLGRGPESLERQRPTLTTGMRSGRSISTSSLGTTSLGTHHSDEALLTGTRKARRPRPLVGAIHGQMPETILEDDMGEDSSRSASGKSGNRLMIGENLSNDVLETNSGSTGSASKLPNLFGGKGGVGGGIKKIRRKFKAKKPSQSLDDDYAGAGGLLQSDDDGEFDDSMNRSRMELAGLTTSFGTEPLPLPPGTDTDDEGSRGGGGGGGGGVGAGAKLLLDKMNVKGVLSNLKLPKKLPGKSLMNRKGSIMMNDDGQ